MNISIKNILKKKQPKKCEISLAGNVITINCKGCKDDGTESTVCIKCMASAVSELGVPSGILLRSYNDKEYSGEAVEVLGVLSKIVSLISTCDTQESGKCGSCICSPKKCMSTIWKDMPTPRFDIIRLDIERMQPKNEKCRTCLEYLQYNLDEIESIFSNAVELAAGSAYHVTEVRNAQTDL